MNPEESVPDERTPRRRRADALTEASERLLTQGQLPETEGQRPHLILILDYPTLATKLDNQSRDQGLDMDPGMDLDIDLDHGSGATAGRTELPAPSVRRLACDAGPLPAVLGTTGQVLELGRTARTASPAQRRALALRDGGRSLSHSQRPRL